MDAALTPFDYRKHGIRAVEVDGETWLVALDACRTLSLGRTKDTYMVRKVMAYLNGDEKRTVNVDGKMVLAVSELGLLKLVSQSLEPFAQEFDRQMRSRAVSAMRATDAVPQETPSEIIERHHRETRERLTAELARLKAQVEKVEQDLEALDRVSVLLAERPPRAPVAMPHTYIEPPAA